jgi:hypothetical protein
MTPNKTELSPRWRERAWQTSKECVIRLNADKAAAGGGLQRLVRRVDGREHQAALPLLSSGRDRCLEGTMSNPKYAPRERTPIKTTDASIVMRIPTTSIVWRRVGAGPSVKNKTMTRIAAIRTLRMAKLIVVRSKCARLSKISSSVSNRCRFSSGALRIASPSCRDRSSSRPNRFVIDKINRPAPEIRITGPTAA